MQEEVRPTLFTILKEDRYNHNPYYALIMHGSRHDGASIADFSGATEEEVVKILRGSFYCRGGREVLQVSEEEFYRIQAERKTASNNVVVGP